MKNGEKPIVNPFVLLREEFDDWAVLFDPDTGRGFGLNPAGVFLWKLLDGRHTIDGLLAEISRSTENVPEMARDHIGTFVDALVVKALAGFDNNESAFFNHAHMTKPHPEKCSSSPPGLVSEMKPFTYEPPKLVDLSRRETARGDCTNGYSPGTYAQCGSGASAGEQCQNGTSATQGCLCTGSTAGSSYECKAGPCPSGTCYSPCSAGGQLCNNGGTAIRCSTTGTTCSPTGS